MSGRDNFIYTLDVFLDQTVWSKDLNAIHAFIKQHNLDRYKSIYDEINTLIVDDETYKNYKYQHDYYSIGYTNEETELFQITFKTNDKSTISIYSTDRLLRDSIYYIAGLLTQACSFGPLIIRDNIPFINDINQLIDALPHAVKFEWLLVDSLHEEPGGYYDRKLTRSMNNSVDCPTDDDYIFDTMIMEYESILNDIEAKGYSDYPMPITIEGYISYFRTLIMEASN